jgi:hypothetical protein
MKPLIEALAKARANFSPICKEATAWARGKEYRYATLDDIIAATAPALSAHGLHVYHSCAVVDKNLEVTCHLTDGEHELTSKVYLPMTGLIEQSNLAQAAGSLLTYGRRYSISALLAVATEPDDDGDLVGKQGKQEGEKPKPAIEIKAKASNPDSTKSQKAMEWLNLKFDEYRVPVVLRARIIAEAKGKTRAQLIREMEEASSHINGHIHAESRGWTPAPLQLP